MNREEYGIITFESTHHAMAAESALKEQGIFTKTIPTPRDITLSCGLSILVTPDNIEKVQTMGKECNLKFKTLYRLVVENGKRNLEIIE